MTPDLKVALQNLRDFPESPSRDFSDGLSGEERHAEKLIDLAEAFVTALGKAGGSKELRDRHNLFLNHTGSGSEYNTLRKAGYKWTSWLFKEASPDAEVDRISIPQPYKGFKFQSACLSHGFINRSDVEKYLGDAESVLWCPCELLDFCDDLLELFPDQMLCCLSENLDGLRGRIRTRHLWGAFLLAAAHDAISNPDPQRYGKLRMTIIWSKDSVAEIKAAAEDLVARLPMDAGQTPTTAGGKVSGEAKPVAEEAAGALGGSPSQADDFAKAPQKRHSRGANRKDPEGDRKIYEAWETGQYKTLADCGRAFDKTGRQVELALGRYRKYLNRHSGKG